MTVCVVLSPTNLALLCFVPGDFNINLLCRKVSKSFWQLGLKQLVTEPMCTDAHYTNGSFSITSSLIGHIYVLSKQNVASVYVTIL